MDEKEMVQRIISNDKDAFEKLVDEYKNKILSLCYSYTLDYSEAEDISQEIFLSIYRNIKNFKGNSTLSTYIYKISVNKCIDYKRKKKFKTFFVGLIPLPQSNNTNDDFQKVDEKYHVRKEISLLPEELKVPIVLYYFLGLTQKEIAQILEISEKGVEGRIYRAKGKLKKVLMKGVVENEG